MGMNYQEMINQLYNPRTGHDFYRRIVSGERLKNLTPASLADLVKADDPLTTAKAGYFNSIFGRIVNFWLNYESVPWNIIEKATYAQKGDSWRYQATNPVNFYGQKESDNTLGDSDVPEPVEATFTDPAQMYNRWNAKLIAILKAGWTDSPGASNEAYMFDVMKKLHPLNISEWLMKSTDTPAIGGGTHDAYLESIDRLCSDDTESAELSAPEDNDIYGFDRSAGEFPAYVDLGSPVGTQRDLDLAFIEDMVTFCKQYSDNNRFILLTGHDQVNTIQRLEDTKQRYYADEGKWKISIVNGVQTREGQTIGFPVSEIVSSGVRIPIFETQHAHNTGGVGSNIYLLDLDQIDIRVALPTVYLRTENKDFALVDDLRYEYNLLTVAQLCAPRALCHGAIKYLN